MRGHAASSEAAAVRRLRRSLDNWAATPGETALAVLGEIIARRYGQSARSLRSQRIGSLRGSIADAHDATGLRLSFDASTSGRLPLERESIGGCVRLAAHTSTGSLSSCPLSANVRLTITGSIAERWVKQVRSARASARAMSSAGSEESISM